jgi:hypothetical protein
MTVQSKILSEQHPGDGVNVDFEFGFKIENSSELVVTLIEDSTGTPAVQTLTTHYTVVIDEDDGTGTVTMVTAPPIGYTLDLRPVYELLQPMRIKNQGRFLPEVHERVFDRQAVFAQYLYRLVRNSVRLPDIGIQNGELSPRSNWLNRYVYLNADGELEPAAAIAVQTLTQTSIGALLYPQLGAETAGGVAPTNLRHRGDPAKGYSVLRTGADPTGATSSSTAIANAIAAAKNMGVQLAGGSAGRDQGVDVYLPAGLYTIDNPIVLPRSGNSRNWCVGLIGDGEATRIQPSATFPAGRALIEWEPSTARLFNQRIKNLKLEMRDGLAHKAIWFKLNDPGTTVFNGQQYGQEEIKELDLDVMIHGSNQHHALLVDIEGKIKFSHLRIVADMTPGAPQTYSTIILRANSPYIGTDGLPGNKSDSVNDNAGVNFCYVDVFGINARGGRTTAFKGRLHNCFVERIGTATGALGSESVVELYGSTCNVFARMFGEGRQEDPQVYLEECHFNQFLSCNLGTPDAPGPGTAFQLVGCEDNVFWNHPSADGKPAYSAFGGFLLRLDANSKRNKFFNFHSDAASFASEVEDLGVDNYIEFFREDTGAYTQSHRRADFSVGPWTQDNAAASQTDVELSGARWIAPRAGRLMAVTVKSTEARTAGTLTIKVFKNPAAALYGAAGAEVSASFRATLDGTNTIHKTTLAANEYTFEAGDEIYPVILTGGTWTPVTSDVRVWLEVQC